MHSLSRGTIGAKLQIVWQETRGMPRLHIGAPAGFLRNARTGAIRIAALFANPDNTLRPGEYARVRFSVRSTPGALLVPQRAVSELQGGYQVAVVGGDNKVNIRAWPRRSSSR